MSDDINILQEGTSWMWRSGDVEVEVSDPHLERGAIRAVVAVRQEDALVTRTRLNLTSKRERERWQRDLREAGLEVPGGVILALDEGIRGGLAPRGGERPLVGSVLDLKDPDPWPTPVAGAELLDELVSVFTRHLVLPAAGAHLLALWVLHTHSHDAGGVSPFLAIISPEKRCGKTTVLLLLSPLVPRGIQTANLTPAVLFRAIDAFKPTLLIDEADTFLKDRDELRGILNSGHNRGSAHVIRTVGDDHEARLFKTWAPKAIAMIGSLPDTLSDRSVTLPLRRRRPDEVVEPVRLDRLEHLDPLCSRACRWGLDNLDRLRNTEPEVPAELHDRAADNWRPLLAIAEVAGGEWPRRALAAARLLSGQAEAQDSSDGTLLLSDLRDLFDAAGEDRLSSAQLVEALGQMEDRPWPEWRGHKVITPQQLAHLLKPFGVSPKQIRDEGGRGPKMRGYLRDGLEEAWARYVPQAAAPGSVHPVHSHLRGTPVPGWAGTPGPLYRMTHRQKGQPRSRVYRMYRAEAD